MSAPVKFLFEDDFASGHLGAAKRMVSAGAHEAAITRAEAVSAPLRITVL